MAIRGADSVRGGEGDGNGDGEGGDEDDDDVDNNGAVPLMVLITDARGDEDGAGVGCASLNGEGVPKGEEGAEAPPFIAISTTGLLLVAVAVPSPSAMSARGRRR
jgi:hypothetical protein